jgi:hypothetical protein
VHLSAAERKQAETTFEKLEKRYHYDRASAAESVRFIMNHKYNVTT